MSVEETSVSWCSDRDSEKHYVEPHTDGFYQLGVSYSIKGSLKLTVVFSKYNSSCIKQTTIAYKGK